MKGGGVGWELVFQAEGTVSAKAQKQNERDNLENQGGV